MHTNAAVGFQENSKHFDFSSVSTIQSRTCVGYFQRRDAASNHIEGNIECQCSASHYESSHRVPATFRRYEVRLPDLLHVSSLETRIDFFKLSTCSSRIFFHLSCWHYHGRLLSLRHHELSHVLQSNVHLDLKQLMERCVASPTVSIGQEEIMVVHKPTHLMVASKHVLLTLDV